MEVESIPVWEPELTSMSSVAMQSKVACFCVDNSSSDGPSRGSNDIAIIQRAISGDMPDLPILKAGSHNR